MNRSGVKDYSSAAAWLLGAKSKTKSERTLYEWGTRLKRISTNQISVMYGNPRYGNQQQIITYFSNGTTVIHADAPMYQSVRRIIGEYVDGVKVVVRNFKVIVSTEKDGTTPSKIKNCRSCKGKKQYAMTCWGPRDCYEESCETAQEYRKVREEWLNSRDSNLKQQVLFTKMSSLIHNHGTCSHGYNKSHPDYTNLYDCYRCKATGKVDYGQKRRGRMWDRSLPFVISPTGDVIEDAQIMHALIKSSIGGY